jgi:DNA-binding GntR family transcriptional regulator
MRGAISSRIEIRRAQSNGGFLLGPEKIAPRIRTKRYTLTGTPTNMRKPRQAPSRTESTATQLRTEILQGTVSPGELLAESAVAVRLGVSRVPVREALFQLENEGLVEFSSTGRAYVKTLAVRDFEELYFLRLTLEPAAARLARESIAEERTRLEENLTRTRAAASLTELTSLDLDFHQIILEASGNRRLLNLWRGLRSELELWLGQLHHAHQQQSRSTRMETVRAHERLVAAFLNANAQACERLMRDHIQGWREWLPNNFTP